jgi:hypothetical protein
MELPPFKNAIIHYYFIPQTPIELASSWALGPLII